MSDAHFESAFRIDGDHPALSGHFPGHPVVPGVVLLDRVAAAIAEWKRARVVGLAQVKFLRPLLPDEEATLRLDAVENGIRFHIFHENSTIATGQVATVAGEGT